MKKVLIVEDDDMLRQLLVRLLSPKYEILQSRDGTNALEQTVAKRPDLILLDLMLPSLDGFQVLQKIRRFTDPEVSKVPIVVLSNLFEMKDITNAQRYGIAHYFIKAQTDMELVAKKIDEIFG